MDKRKRERLERGGWKVSTVAEFLSLSPDEEALVEARIALTRRIRQVREARGLDLSLDREGFVHVPEGPGIGARIDWDLVERYKVCEI